MTEYGEKAYNEVCAVWFWKDELERIGNSLFEENDPEACEALWKQWYLARYYLRDHLVRKKRFNRLEKKAQRSGVK